MLQWVLYLCVLVMRPTRYLLRHRDGNVHDENFRNLTEFIQLRSHAVGKSANKKQDLFLVAQHNHQLLEDDYDHHGDGGGGPCRFGA